MLVQLSTDSNIHGTERLAHQVEATVVEGLGHLSEQMTRVEVHFSDINSKAKDGVADKRCLIEARPTAHQPVAVSHQAGTIDQALDGAIDKLKRSLESMLGRLEAH